MTRWSLHKARPGGDSCGRRRRGGARECRFGAGDDHHAGLRLRRLHSHSNPYTAVAGTASFAAATAETSRFYLRRDGCGTSNDNPHLSTTTGTDGGDGCGLVLNSVVGLGGDVDQGAFVDFPATDGMPLALDASRGRRPERSTSPALQSARSRSTSVSRRSSAGRE